MIVNKLQEAQPKQNSKKFWNFVDNLDDSAELTLYGPISETSWWGDEVTPKQFKKDLADIGNKSEITVRINSGGGDVFAANAIYTALKDHPAHINIKVDGLAASAATIIAMAGDTIMIPSNAYMMIHNPKTMTFDYLEAKDMRQMANTLDTIKEGIMNAYVGKTGKSKKELSKMMDSETWMTGEEAVEQGFADEVMFNENIEDSVVMKGNLLVVNTVTHDLSKFKHRPILPTNNRAKPQKSEVIDNMRRKREEINNMAKECLCADCSKTEEDCKCSECGLCPECCASPSCCGCECPMKCENTTVSNCAARNKKNTQNTATPKVNYKEAHNSGVSAERERLKAFDALNGKVDPEFLAKAKYEDGATAEKVLFMAMQKGKLINAAYLANAELDASTANDVPGGASDSAKPSEVAGILNKVAVIAKKTLGIEEGGK
jgi:ATP-dependent protease ClpP protease subunit